MAANQFMHGQHSSVHFDSAKLDQLTNRIKDLEYDNFRLEKRLSETLSRQWRIETLFNTYVFSSVVRDKYEQSKYYCSDD